MRSTRSRSSCGGSRWRLPDPLHEAAALVRRGSFGDAARLIEPVYLAHPDNMGAMLVLGLAVAGCGQPDLAADLLDEVAQRRPGARHPAHDAIETLAAAGRHDAVRAYLDAAVTLAPLDARLLEAAGGWLQSVDRGAEARPILERAVTLGSWDARVSLAAVLADTGAIETAIAQLEDVIRAGRGGAAALGNLGVMHSVQGRAAEAITAFEAARRLDPSHTQLAVNHGMALLKSGRLSEGWELFNRRLAQSGQLLLPPGRMLPIGAGLGGRVILVTHDSGLGDTLQFARFLPMLAQAGARVLLWAPKSLQRLLAPVPGVALVFSDDRVWPTYDWHCPIMRLAEVFATTLDTIPPTPYLEADPAMVDHWAERLPPRAGRRRIGIVWAGSEREAQPELSGAGRRRNLDLAALHELLAVTGVQWISLQLGGPAPSGVVDIMPDVRDLADTAAIITSLDAVVSVDTAVAHLAGALGVTTHLLDRYDHCWRWVSGRDTTPWYRTMRIHRQPSWGDWAKPVAHLSARLGQADGFSSPG